MSCSELRGITYDRYAAASIYYIRADRDRVCDPQKGDRQPRRAKEHHGPCDQRGTSMQYCHVLCAGAAGQRAEGLRDDLSDLGGNGDHVHALCQDRLQKRRGEQAEVSDLRNSGFQRGISGQSGGGGRLRPMGLMLASVYLIPVRVIMWSKGIAIFSGESDRRQTLRKVVTHPCVIACMIGIVIMLADLLAHVSIVPEWVFDMLQTVGRCNTGLSMMVIGMILSDIDRKQLMDKLVIRYTLERLILIPGVLGMILLGLARIGIVTGLAPNLAVLLAAMPAPATTSMLSSKYNCAPDFATKMVILSTLCSIPTIFLWGLVLKASG